MRRCIPRTFVPAPSFLTLGIALITSRQVEPAAHRIQEQPPLVLKARSAEVLVDVVVTDKENALRRKLKRDDFTVYEDDVPQAIAGFELVNSRRVVRREVQPNLSAGSARRGLGKQAAAAPAAPAGANEGLNYTMLLLDFSSMDWDAQYRVRRGAMKFIEQKMQPNDRIAVLAFTPSLRLLTDFTSDREKLVKAVSYRRAVAGAQGGASRNEMTPQPPPDALPATMPRAESDPRWVSLGSLLQPGAEPIDTAVDSWSTHNVLGGIKTIARATSNIRGRKALVFFSTGIRVPPDLDFLLVDTVSTANRATLSVYAVDAQGLNYRSPRNQAMAGMDSTRPVTHARGGEKPLSGGGGSKFDNMWLIDAGAAQATLRYLSERTGGLWIHNTNDFAGGLERAQEDAHEYYVLSYQPKRSELDGSYRKIRVEVNKRNSTVRARDGYYAVPPDLEPLPGSDAQLVLEGRRMPASGTQMYVGTGVFRHKNAKYRVPIVFEIPASALHFEKIPEGYEVRVHTLGILSDSANSGSIVSYAGSSHVLKVPGEAFLAWQSGSVRFVESAEAPPGSYTLQAYAKDTKSGALFQCRQGVYLRPYDGSFAVGAVLLANRLDPWHGDSGDSFLMAGSARIVPSARRQFRNGDNLILYFDVYNPLTASDTKQTDVTVKLRLLKDGRPVPAKLPEYRIAGTPDEEAKLTLSRFVELAGLTPGGYSVLIEVTDNIGHEVDRTLAPFTIVR